MKNYQMCIHGVTEREQRKNAKRNRRHLFET